MTPAGAVMARPSAAVPPDYPGRAVLMADGFWYAVPPRSPADVNLNAIIETICGIQRYNGLVPALTASGMGWTVGQHTLALVRWARHAGEPAAVLRELFAHDLAEAYIGDIVGPVKLSSPDLRVACKELEAVCDVSIRVRLGLPEEPDPETAAVVKDYDRTAVAVEAVALGFIGDALARCVAVHTSDPRTSKAARTRDAAVPIFRGVVAVRANVPRLLGAHLRDLFSAALAVTLEARR